MADVHHERSARAAHEVRAHSLDADHADEAGALPPDVWHLLRETPGFLGFARPEPMAPAEVEAPLRRVDAPIVEPAPTLDLAPGEHVRVIEGSLAGLEGTVEQVQPETGAVRVLLGRATPVDLEHRKVERVEG